MFPTPYDEEDFLFLFPYTTPLKPYESQKSKPRRPPDDVKNGFDQNFCHETSPQTLFKFKTEHAHYIYVYQAGRVLPVALAQYYYVSSVTVPRRGH